MYKTNQKKLKKFILIFCITICCIFFIALIAIGIIYNHYSLDVAKLTAYNNGIVVYASEDEQPKICNTNRSIVKLTDLPQYVPTAFIDTEDKRFYTHRGYDLKRIIKATIINIATKSKTQGASTISQQLIKNSLLTNEKTYKRKVKEIILAIKMEKQFTKDEILEMYLNTIYFGSNAYGIENASKIYFNKSAKDLSINEACCLAGLIKSPYKFSPITNLEASVERKNLVAGLMYKQQDISKETYNEIIEQSIDVSTNEALDFSYEKEAIYEACSLLNITERELINNGYQIITNKDTLLQNLVIESNSSNIKDNSLDSVSIIASNEGKILAYYENSNYNLHKLHRQPASTLKPFAVYLPCIAHNILTPASILLDEPTNFNGFEPHNAGNKYYGYITTKVAIAKSSNICAVKALEYVGLNKAKETLIKLGFNIQNCDLNLNLALGLTRNGTTLIELLNAYSTLANLGVYKPLSFISKILSSDGKILYDGEIYAEKILDAGDCFLINDMLKQTIKTGTAKRMDELNLPISAKTGTAYNGKQNTDLYNITYSTQHTVLTWVSNLKDNTIPNNLLSSVLPTQINKEILKTLYQTKKPEDYKIPSNIKLMPYDLLELQENHVVVEPNTSIERYMGYEYFKTDFPPAKNPKKDIIIKVDINNLGANISFNTNLANTYAIYKETKHNKMLLKDITNSSGEINIIDPDIYSYNEITYYVISNNNVSNTVKIMPKAYLINKLNNEILSNKKRWPA